MTESEWGEYLGTLLRLPTMQGLWQVKDRGMPVFAHTIDVALLSLEAYPLWRERYPALDLTAVVVGALLHDLTKLTAEEGPARSHSHIMSAQPGVAVEAAVEVLNQVAASHQARPSPACVDRIKHVVASHHGVWGRVRPRTPEALLVHRSDYYSACHHRLAPVDANDILPLLNEGYGWQHVSVRLGVGRAVVKARLQESCKAELVREWVDLMEIWRSRGSVCPGEPERQRQIERARLVIRLAREVPESLLTEIRRASGREATRAGAPGSGQSRSA